jgi:hypothetical protein
LHILNPPSLECKKFREARFIVASGNPGAWDRGHLPQRGDLTGYRLILFRHDRFLYLAGLPDDRWLGDLVKMAVTEQELPIVDLPEGVRTRRFGSIRCFFNYNPYPVQVSPVQGLETLVGGTDLPPAGVLIGRGYPLQVTDASKML